MRKPELRGALEAFESTVFVVVIAGLCVGLIGMMAGAGDRAIQCVLLASFVAAVMWVFK